MTDHVYYYPAAGLAAIILFLSLATVAPVDAFFYFNISFHLTYSAVLPVLMALSGATAAALVLIIIFSIIFALLQLCTGPVLYIGASSCFVAIWLLSCAGLPAGLVKRHWKIPAVALTPV